MTTHRILLTASCLAAATIGMACASMEGKNDDRVSFAQTPPAVQAAITKTLAGATAEKIELEDADGKQIYEVTYHVNGQERSAEFTPAGDTIEQESDIAVTNLPAPVTSAVMAKYHGATIKEAADVSADGQRFYELGVQLADHSKREVQVNADGSIRADKVEDEKD